MPGWHDATKSWQEDGDVRMLGIIQEQHPDRARLFMQWKRMDWPILVDSLNLLEVPYVPITLAIDEHGVIREVQPDLDDLEGFRRRFVEAEFEPPSDERTTSPRLTALRRALSRVGEASGSTSAAGTSAMRESADGDAVELRARAAALFLTGDDDLDAVVDAFEAAVAAEPEHAYTLFRTGVAYRQRYDSPDSRSGDFQKAVEYWQRALDRDPNNYIWRRRIQQYGPRLDKPYPFYDWIPKAREQIEARGEEPAPLRVEPGGAEFAEPTEEFLQDRSPEEPPEVDDRILRDDGHFVIAELATVPSVVEPGDSLRAHVTLTPNDAVEAHWNNEVDDTVVWLEAPEGWKVSRDVISVPRPPEIVSREPRTVETEIQVPDGVEAGSYQLPAHALYYVCEDVNGICLYRRQDLTIDVRVRAPDDG